MLLSFSSFFIANSQSVVYCCLSFFFFKQKTAYEMRISDWISDVCSSDLLVGDATVSTADEKYGLSWHGKRQARQIALTPSTGTLLPRPDESVEWDGTRNLLIEGDNLEVLKLLQKSYNRKIKAIYIDPPYNRSEEHTSELQSLMRISYS